MVARCSLGPRITHKCSFPRLREPNRFPKTPQGLRINLRGLINAARLFATYREQQLRSTCPALRPLDPGIESWRRQSGKIWDELGIARPQAARHNSLWRRSKNRKGRRILKDHLPSSSRSIIELAAVFCGTESALPAKYARKMLLRFKAACQGDIQDTDLWGA